MRYQILKEISIKTCQTERLWMIIKDVPHKEYLEHEH